MNEANYDSLKVEIDNIKEDIKEIKQDQKETNNYYRQVIGELKENAIQQTQILSKYDQQFSEVKSDITELNVKIDTTIEKHKVDITAIIKYVFAGIGGLILGYIGMKLGIK